MKSLPVSAPTAVQFNPLFTKKNDKKDINDSSLVGCVSSVVPSSKKEINKLVILPHTAEKSLFYRLKSYLTYTNQQPVITSNEYETTSLSLMQQADDIASALRARQASPSPPGFTLKGATGLLLGMGLISSAIGTFAYNRFKTRNTEPVSNDMPVAFAYKASELNSNTVEVGHSVDLNHDGMSLTITNDNSTVMLKKNIFESSLYAMDHPENKKIIKYLIRKNVLKDAFMTKSVLITSLVYHLYSPASRENTRELKMAARAILADADCYGGTKGESISLDEADFVIRGWVLNKVFGMSLENYLASKMAVSSRPAYFTVNSIKYLVSLQNVRREKLFDIDLISISSQDIFSAFWNDSINAELPFLNFSHGDIEYLPLFSEDFENLYAGAKYANNNKSMHNFSPLQLIDIGAKIWALALNENVDFNNIGFYLLPSLFFQASNFPEKIAERGEDFVINMIAVNDYIIYKSAIYEKIQKLNDDLNHLTLLHEAWLSKGQLADKIIADCPKSELKRLSEETDTKRIEERNHEVRVSAAKEAYLNEISKPCKNAPESIAEEYKKRVDEITVSFSKVDRVFIEAAFNSLEWEDASFIFSNNSVIHAVDFNMKMFRRTKLYDGKSAFSNLIPPEIRVHLVHTDLIHVMLYDEERIYALHKINTTKGLGYIIRHVNEDIDENDFLKNGYIDYNHFGNDIDSAGEYIKQHGIKAKVNLVDSIADDLVTDKLSRVVDFYQRKHKDEYYKSIFERYNDKSSIQSIWNVVKDFLPFYSCIENIQGGNYSEAAIACVTDILSLVPVAGSSLRMGSRFGLGLAKGVLNGKKTLSVGTIRRVNSEFLREIRPPRVSEIMALGKQVIQVLDPGIELLTTVSNVFAMKIYKSLKKEYQEKFLSGQTSSLSIAEQRPKKTQQYIDAFIPNSDVVVQVKKIGHHRHDDVYAIVKPESGVVWGKKYTLSTEGFLQPFTLGFHMQEVRGKNYRSAILFHNTEVNVPVYPRVHNGNQIVHFTAESHAQRFIQPFIFITENHSFNLKAYDQDVLATISEGYQRNDFFIFKFDQSIDTIPYEYQRLRSNIQTYKNEIFRAGELVRNLYSKFKKTTMYNTLTGDLDYGLNNEIKTYLTKVLCLNTVHDLTLRRRIEKEAMKRLLHHTQSIYGQLNYFDGRIHFVSCHKKGNPYVNIQNTFMGFTCAFNPRHDIYIMVDNFHGIPVVSSKMSITALHEASHSSGSLDFMIAPTTAISGDASLFMPAFDDALYGRNDRWLHIDARFLNDFRFETQNDLVDEEHLREILKGDHMLRINAFMENADFIARMISDLGSQTPYKVGRLARSKKQGKAEHDEIIISVFKLAMCNKPYKLK